MYKLMNRLQLTKIARTLPILLAVAGTGLAYSAEQADAGRVLVPNITGVVILPNDQALRYEGIKPSELPDRVEVKGPDFLNTKEVQDVVTKYIGQPLTVGSLDALQKELILVSRKQGHYVVDVFYVEDVDVTDGVVQVVVHEGILQNLTVRNQGRK